MQKFSKRLTFDKVTESSKVGTFLRHSVETPVYSVVDTHTDILNLLGVHYQCVRQTDGQTDGHNTITTVCV